MSDSDFLLGLSWSINRKEFGENIGCGAPVDFFGDGYLSNPEEGIAYNSTDAHKNAVASLTDNGNNPYGYDLEKAKAYFKQAATKWLKDGTYSEGDTIEIEIAWQAETEIETLGAPLKQYIETAFNDASVCENKLTLNIKNVAVATWSDVYYKKMMVGQFDIAFGSISGNTMNPLNFLEVLKSDNSSQFTLNWGVDTSEVNLEYKGSYWSFDSLWQAADTGGYFEQGEFIPVHDAELVSEDPFVYNEDGSVTVTIDTKAFIGFEGIKIDVENVVLYFYLPGKVYVEASTDWSYDAAKGIVTATVSASAWAQFTSGNHYASHGIVVGGFDVSYVPSYNGVPTTELDSVDRSGYGFDENLHIVLK